MTKKTHTNVNDEIKELTDFLDKYDVKYKVVRDRVEADSVIVSKGITQLPNSIGKLKCESLRLYHNKLTSLPDSIGKLKCKYIYLDNNKLTSLPDSIGKLKCECLYLYNNELTQLPDSIGKLKCEYLDLNNNKLTQLPDSFGNLKCKYLWLNFNNITQLPDSIVKLKCEYLDLNNNQLTSKAIALLEKLKSAGVNVNYQQTKQTNNGCKIMTNCANIVEPDHYKKGAFQTIDFIEDFLDNESRLLTAKQKYLIGNAIRYLSRAGLKGSTPEDAITDLKEAENYIHRAITGEWINDV